MWLLLAAILAKDPEPLPLPTWMAGCWEERIGERWATECWSLPDGALMRGEGSSGVGKVAKSRETMTIAYGETDDQPGRPFMTYHATPAGSARTFFRWVASETKLTFVNEAHDYPQRIRYWREGKHLIAEVSLADGSKAKRWRYTAMGR